MSNAVSVYSMSFGSIIETASDIFVIVLFLESLTVKSSYYKKNTILQALFQIL